MKRVVQSAADTNAIIEENMRSSVMYVIARDIIPIVVIAAAWRDMRDFFFLYARMIWGIRA